LPAVRRSSPHQASASPLGATMRMPRCGSAPSASRSMPNISARDADGFADSRCVTYVTARSSADSSARMSARMRVTSPSRCAAECAAKFASARPTTNRVATQTIPANKTKSAAMRIAALMFWGWGETESLLFPTAPYRRHRPLLTLLLQSDVQLARLGLAADLNGPQRGDLVLPLRAFLARFLLLERARMNLAEQSVEEVGGLIAPEEPIFRDKAGELQHDLVTGGDAGHDDLWVAVAETHPEILQRRVEVAELRRRDER